MKILFFGLGSIGQRHAGLILRNFKHSLFAYRSNKLTRPNQMGIRELYSWEQVRELSPDVAFISNPTSLHIKTAIECAKLGINLFLEKPIDCSIERLDELMEIARKRKLTTYVAYCMRFHPIIRRLYRYLLNNVPVHCRITVSSYLPDWRKGRDYREVYSAHSRQGGGVILDLSHEIDYSQYLFGEVLKMQGQYGRISNLEIDSEDYADILMKCKKGIVNLHLNYFSKNIERTIKIDFKDYGFVQADLIANTLLIRRDGVTRRYNYGLKRKDIFLEQLNYFFKNFKNRKMMNNLFDAGKLFKNIIGFKNAK